MNTAATTTPAPHVINLVREITPSGTEYVRQVCECGTKLDGARVPGTGSAPHSALDHSAVLPHAEMTDAEIHAWFDLGGENAHLFNVRAYGYR